MLLYLLNAENTNLYKIGITKNKVEKRILSLQTGNPNKINLVWVTEIENAALVENTVHRHYSYCREVGEWFDFDNISVEDVKTKILKIEENIKFLKENEKKDSD